MERLLNVRRARSRDARYAKSVAPQDTEPLLTPRRARSRDARFGASAAEHLSPRRGRHKEGRHLPNFLSPSEPPLRRPRRARSRDARYNAPPTPPSTGPPTAPFEPPPFLPNKLLKPKRGLRRTSAPISTLQNAANAAAKTATPADALAAAAATPEIQSTREIRRGINRSGLHFSRSDAEASRRAGPYKSRTQERIDVAKSDEFKESNPKFDRIPSAPAIGQRAESTRKEPPVAPLKRNVPESRRVPELADNRNDPQQSTAELSVSSGPSFDGPSAQKLASKLVNRMPDRPRSPNPSWSRTAVPSAVLNAQVQTKKDESPENDTIREQQHTKDQRTFSPPRIHGKSKDQTSQQRTGALPRVKSGNGVESKLHESALARHAQIAKLGRATSPKRAERDSSTSSTRRIGQPRTRRMMGRDEAVSTARKRAVAPQDQAIHKMPTALEKGRAVEQLVDALRKNGETVSIIENSLKALAKIMGVHQNREAIGNCGGLEAVIAAMGRHADVAAVQADGAKLLALAVWTHAANKEALVSGFGVDAIVTAMRGFTHEAEVQTRACQALHNVADSDAKYKEIAGLKGGVNAAIEALAAHTVHPEVVERASMALRTLVCGVPANVERLSNSSEWATVLLAVLGAHSMDEAVQTCLLAVLAEAARGHPKKIPQLISAGALGAALTAMRRNVHRREVLLAGAGAARALLETGAKEADAALRAAGGVATLIDMLHCSVTAPLPPNSSVTTTARDAEW